MSNVALQDLTPLCARGNGKWIQMNNVALQDLTPLCALKGINGIPSFNEMTQRTTDWSRINRIVFDQNAYGNIREVLKALGIVPITAKDYNTQFGTVLNKRTLQKIVPVDGNLLMTNGDIEVTPMSDQILLEQLQGEFDIQPGEVDMLTMSTPDMPPQQVPVVVLAKAKEPSKSKFYGTIGECAFVENRKEVYSENVGNSSRELLVRDAAANIFHYKDASLFAGMPEMKAHPERFQGDDKYFGSDDIHNATIQILVPPKHGKLTHKTSAFQEIYYSPDVGYVGNDKAVFLVDVGGYKIKAIYYLKVTNIRIDPALQFDKIRRIQKDYCPKSEWLISYFQGNKLTTINSLSTDPASWQRNVNLSALLAGASQSFTGFQNLSGSAVAQTTGEGTNAQITLDTTAAGHNWFVDPTPDQNEEFLPTSNPNIWQAKSGTDAAGKMDMLSVLLHEYGHALGLEHSPDPRDFMAATLQPGERRLPSPEELTLMSQLVAELKQGSASPSTPTTPQSPFDPSLPLGAGFSVMALGRLRRTSFGSWALSYENTKATAPSVPHYEVAVNSTLINGKLNDSSGWVTEGNVAIGNGAATLSEVSSSQSRLNQAFVLGEHDRFLSFTLANIALDDQATGPDDAFEVGLLDANTGSSLMSGVGLTHTDAIINLQTNGNEFRAQGIKRTTNADGSRTYVLDLSNIAAGTAVNLSFDLIGFGNTAATTKSHVTIRDLRLGVPQPTNDVVSLAEDTPIVIDALANDLDAHQPGFTSVVVDSPTHGQVTVNADGTFTFTPEKDWNGEDSFTYKLSDGNVDSNIATVNLTVTPVNDAPVTQDDTTNVAEDGVLTANGNVLVNDSDVDLDTVLKVTVPGTYAGVYGSLTLSEDGAYSYTLANDSAIVQALRVGEVVTDVFAYAATDGITSTAAQLTVSISGKNDAAVVADDVAQWGK